MGPRHKHRPRLEALESRWLMSASSGSNDHPLDVDFDNDSAVEAAAFDHAPSGREVNNSDDSRPVASELLRRLRSNSPTSIAGLLHTYGGGSKPIDPYLDAPPVEEPSKVPYQSRRGANVELKSPDEAADDQAILQQKSNQGLPITDPDIDKQLPRPRETKAPLLPPGSLDQRHEERVEVQNQPAQPISISAPSQSSTVVIAPEIAEATPEPSEPESRAETVDDTGSLDEMAGQSNSPDGNTVSASPLGSAGVPIVRAVDELGNSAPSDESKFEDIAFDVSSAAVAAFWSALEMMPLASISAPLERSSDELAGTILAKFDSLTAAVDTLLDSLAAQFDLSGPGRMRDILFASSAALLTALACEKVRRRQQRLEDENLTSLGFDADGYLSLAEGL